MALTPEERKEKLGFGGLTRVAKQTHRSVGHVSQVNDRKREDAVVERAIARAILKRHPELSPDEIWPAKDGSVATAIAGGM
jgi:hypothetical protein